VKQLENAIIMKPIEKTGNTKIACKTLRDLFITCLLIII